ncbi:spike protein [Ferret coronavirus]|uniref:Spike protein n=5 Tax=Ferret coronavirus TaxID=1264898 RepID=A0A172AZS6_9ALPC|nr:spike protein [Ferret coronavirus]AKG92640.1 spike protein [Ferret coronavirus]
MFEMRTPVFLTVCIVLLQYAHCDTFNCSTLHNTTLWATDQTRLLDYFIANYSSRLPTGASVVLGDYFPTLGPWYDCVSNTTYGGVVLEDLRALYLDHQQGVARDLAFAVYGYPYTAIVVLNKELFNGQGYGGLLCFCNGNSTIPAFNANCSTSCTVRSFRLCADESICHERILGLKWSSSEVVAYLAGEVYSYKLSNHWYNNVTIKTQTNANQIYWWFNPVRDLSYYNVNKTVDSTIVVSNCTSDCSGYAANIFAVETGGFIPSSFSFNNWFVLTNSSTIVSGKFVSSQPLLVNCLTPVPSFGDETSIINFDTVPSQCNGATVNGSFDVVRFNLNFTANVASSSGTSFLALNTTGGVVLYLSCFNETKTTNLYMSEGALPFGTHEGALYCYVSYNETSFKYIGVLPPSVKEIAVSKWGFVYINGYNYFQTFPIDSVAFNLTTGNSGAFWTIAYTTFTDVLLEVSDTQIKSVTYCNSHINDIKCSQMSENLPDGFYPVSQHSLPNVNKTFVTLPANFEHTSINVTGNVLLIYYAHPVFRSGNVTLHPQGTQTICVNTTQFTFNFDSQCHQLAGGGCDGIGASMISIDSGNCPFSPDKLNQHLAFETLCFSTLPTGSDCAFSLTVQNRYFTRVFAHLFVTYKYGLDHLGVQTPDVGVKDLSVVYQNVCTEYNIYGHAGVGIIRSTNQTLLGGLYYTSLSGDLLGFKNVTTGEVYSIVPCQLSAQAAVINGKIVGAVTSVQSPILDLPHHIVTPQFYYHSIYNYSATPTSYRTNNGFDKYLVNCTPIITYSNMGVCENGALVFINITQSENPVQPISTGNVTIPSNFTISVQVEYLQMSSEAVSIDCAQYVCNGNPRCNRLLAQYISACHAIEQALITSTRLEALELESMISISDNALALATVETFNSSDYLDPVYNDQHNTIGGIYMDGLKDLLPRRSCANKHGTCRSVIEELLFNKVVTSGLGTVDEDYKRCTNGLDIADLVCAQYYNGIMVLPGVVNADKMAMYTASLAGGITLGALGGGLVSVPFATAVQARLNYVALQTDVLQQNQKILAASFNQAIGNITLAFGKVNSAIQQTAQGLSTVAQALTKVQDVVNSQGKALNHLTAQLQNNFQAISSSIEDIYYKLDEVNADAQVDRLITGRLASLNAFVTQTLTNQAQIRASRQLSKEKINECVRSQSSRFGFCGNGTHLFSLANAAPRGVMLFHTVLLPTSYKTVTAWSGVCAISNNKTMGFIVKDVSLTLFKNHDDKFYLTPRTMYEPRVATMSDFVQIESCTTTFVNATVAELPSIIPDYIDINGTIKDMLDQYKPNWTVPELTIDVFNQTYLNLTGEINELENRSVILQQTVLELESLIDNINGTLVNLEWLNRVETFVKWPWWVWVIIGLILLIALPMLLFCCLSTGCCGCCGCLTSCLAGCCKNSCKRPSYYEPMEKVHIN